MIAKSSLFFLRHKRTMIKSILPRSGDLLSLSSSENNKCLRESSKNNFRLLRWEETDITVSGVVKTPETIISKYHTSNFIPCASGKSVPQFMVLV